MEFLQEFISMYGTTILSAILTAIFGYLGVVIKRNFNDEAKKEVVKTCVKAVEQMYKDLHGEEKLQKALEAVSDMLASKNITITDTELRMLIESAVGEFNDVFNSKEKQDAEKKETK